MAIMLETDPAICNGCVADSEISPSIRRGTVVVKNPQGLHMRPANRVSELARGFRSSIVVRNGAKSADGRSMINLVLLIVEPGTELCVEAEGDDAEAAVNTLVEYLGAEDWEC